MVFERSLNINHCPQVFVSIKFDSTTGINTYGEKTYYNPGHGSQYKQINKEFNVEFNTYNCIGCNGCIRHATKTHNENTNATRSVNRLILHDINDVCYHVGGETA